MYAWYMVSISAPVLNHSQLCRFLLMVLPQVELSALQSHCCCCCLVAGPGTPGDSTLIPVTPAQRDSPATNSAATRTTRAAERAMSRFGGSCSTMHHKIRTQSAC